MKMKVKEKERRRKICLFFEISLHVLFSPSLSHSPSLSSFTFPPSPLSSTPVSPGNA